MLNAAALICRLGAGKEKKMQGVFDFWGLGVEWGRGGASVSAGLAALSLARCQRDTALSTTGGGGGRKGGLGRPVGLSRPLSFQFACCEFWSTRKWKGEESRDQFIGTNKTALCWEKAAAALISGGFHFLCDLFFLLGSRKFFPFIVLWKKAFDACSHSEFEAPTAKQSVWQLNKASALK